MKPIDFIAIGLGVVAIVIAALGSFASGPTAGNKTVSFWDTAEGYKVDGTTVINGSGQLALGTTLAGIRTGNCTIWSDANTITASSSVLAVCQSATDGSLASGLTGVTADSICSVNAASSTSAVFGGIDTSNVSASSTAGTILVRILNFTGATFTWTAIASSSAKWQYTCLDPA